MAHKIVMDENRRKPARARCEECLRYAVSESILRDLYPECIKPKRKATLQSSVIDLDYGPDAGKPKKPLWHATCKEFLILCGNRRYLCGCAEFRGNQLFKAREAVLQSR